MPGQRETARLLRRAAISCDGWIRYGICESYHLVRRLRLKNRRPDFRYNLSLGMGQAFTSSRRLSPDLQSALALAGIIGPHDGAALRRVIDFHIIPISDARPPQRLSNTRYRDLHNDSAARGLQKRA